MYNNQNKNKDYFPQDISGLMNHLKTNRGIAVEDRHARQLLNYGYYHAYKGYRFFKKPKSGIPYKSFDEIVAVIDYDNELKACFYPQIMFLETALKNIVVAKVMEGLSSAGFEEIYRHKMTADEGEAMAGNRRHLKDKIKQTICKRYNQDNPVIAHFQQRGDDVPIWGIFEVLSLGDFAMFTKCLDKHIRVSLLRDLKMVHPNDSQAMMLAAAIYTIKDLRNALAHNNVIFDVRFQDRAVDDIVKQWLTTQTQIEGITFDSITDYYILIAVILKQIEYEDEKLVRFFNSMRAIYDGLYQSVPTAIYTKLTTSQLITKLKGLRDYLEIDTIVDI